MRGTARTLSPLRAPAAALLAGACAAAPPAPVAPPTADFAYDATAPALVYQVTDTARFTMQFGDIAFGSAGTVRVEIAPAADSALALRARVIDFSGSFSGPTGTVTADESGARGPFVFTITPDGDVLGRTEPELSREFDQVARSGDPLRALIVQLPEGPVVRGAAWTDTIVIRETTREGARVDNRTIVTATWTGDTIVAGQTLRIIESVSENVVNTTAETGGMEVVNRLTGTTRATILWDPERQILVSRRATGSLSGTVDVPAAGMTGIPIQATLSAAAVLQP